MATPHEHGILITSTKSLEVVFHTASGSTLAAGGIGARHVVGALDSLSADGWDVVGPPTVVETGGVTATSYLLRRPARTKANLIS